MKLSRTEIGEIGVGALVILAVIVIVFLPGDEPKADPPKNSRSILVCIDSTVSTDDVREKYEIDLEKVVRQAAFHQDNFMAAACGANATGEVDWPVGKRFRTTYSNPEYAKEELEDQARLVMEGKEEKQGVSDLLEAKSKETTPVGEMLAVTARQCEQAGGNCEIYFFTDGEWADGQLRIKDGVSEEERSVYLDAYVENLSGFSGSTVHFIGVGLGTEIGELRLNEAKSIATDLIEEAGGDRGYWATRL